MIPSIIKQYDIPFEELEVTPEKILAFIKGRNSALDEFSREFLANFLKQSAGLANVKGGFVYIAPDKFYVSNDFFVLGNTEFSSQKIITSRLRRAKSAALFLVTAGDYFENYSKLLISSGDFFSGYIIDAAASEIAEAAAVWIEKKIDEFAAEISFKTTSRYSPGYCGWWVGEQQKLFSFFPLNFCGIRLTESSLMIPVKSISGIIGAGENVGKEEYECAVCEDENCFRRNIL